MRKSLIFLVLALAASLTAVCGLSRGETLKGTYVALGVGVMFKEDKFQLGGHTFAARGTYTLSADTVTLHIQEWVSVDSEVPAKKEEMSLKISEDRTEISFPEGDPLVRQSENVENWVPDAEWTTLMETHYADAPDGYFSPQFSQDGSKILYLVKTKFHRFYSALVDVKTGQSNALEGLAREAHSAVFIPKSSKILALLKGDIVTMNLDGTSVEVLVSQDNRGEDYSCSYDGKHITFSWSGGSDPMANDYIYTMDANGGNVKRLTDVGVGDSEPSFSPDGKSIIFVSRRAGAWNLFVMNVDGTNIRALTTDDTQIQGPRFSPDGKHIVYSAFPEMNSWDIFVMRSDGTMRKALTKTSGTDNQEHSPSYSPDGTKITFSALRNGVDGIYIMNSDGTGERRLVPRP